MGLGPTTANENARRSQECERGTCGRVRYVGSTTYHLFSRERRHGSHKRVRYVISLHAAGWCVAGQIDDLFGEMLRIIQVFHNQPAIFSRSFYGYVAHTE